jgi:hypothetical protein
MSRKRDQNAIILTDTQAEESRNKVQVNVRLDPRVAERIKNLAWASGDAVNAIIEAGALKELERRERAYEKEHGQPVPIRPKAKLD